MTSDDRAILISLATQLGLALDGMRLSLEVRRAELEAQASQLKAALFSGVSHDVKTPLAAITTSVTSLIDGRGFTEDERREHLETIRQEADRLHRVVNNLLDVARLRAGALVANKTPAAIEEVLESVVRRLRSLLSGREAELRIADDIPEVQMDVVQIDQVLTNLIENAIKFSPTGTPISLAAVGNPHGVRVTVADRGPGIPTSGSIAALRTLRDGGRDGLRNGAGPHDRPRDHRRPRRPHVGVRRTGWGSGVHLRATRPRVGAGRGGVGCWNECWSLTTTPRCAGP